MSDSGFENFMLWSDCQIFYGSFVVKQPNTGGVIKPLLN